MFRKAARSKPRKRSAFAFALALAAVGGAATASADLPSPGQPKEVALLSERCETDLALSAAPEHLREQATVYVLGEQGYRRSRKGTNRFTCIVNRDHPRVLKPTCFDAEGAATIVPKILFFGKRMMEGVATEKIHDELAEAFEAGIFIPARRPGVAYMLSRYNRPFNPQTAELGWFPPHVMFYAPNLTNDDIGHDMTKHNPKQPLPMIGYQGPHGYMIMISDDGTKRSRSDLRDCPDWVRAD